MACRDIPDGWRRTVVPRLSAVERTHCSCVGNVSIHIRTAKNYDLKYHVMLIH